MVDGYSILLADCPARTALEAISGTWSVAAIYALRSGPRTFSQLSGAIHGVSNKVLAETLHRLESRGLVANGPADRSPWMLTELGTSALTPIAGLAEWAQDHAEQIADAQAVTAR